MDESRLLHSNTCYLLPFKELDLQIDEALEEFEQKANEVISALPWVTKVNVTMSARPARPVFAGDLPKGLQTIEYCCSF